MADAYGLAHRAFEWAVGADVTGFLTWLGTVLGLIGLRMTFVQARDARHEASRAAVDAGRAVRAVDRMAKLVSLADSAHVGAQIHMMEEAIARQDYSRLHLIFLSVRRGAEFIVLRAVPDQRARAHVHRTIHKISVQISHANNDPPKFNVATITKALEGLAQSLIEIEHMIQASSAKETTS